MHFVPFVLYIFLSLEAVHVCIVSSHLDAVTRMCTYLSVFSKPWAVMCIFQTLGCLCVFSKPWAVYICILLEFVHWVCGDSWPQGWASGVLFQSVHVVCRIEYGGEIWEGNKGPLSKRIMGYLSKTYIKVVV